MSKEYFISEKTKLKSSGEQQSLLPQQRNLMTGAIFTHKDEALKYAIFVLSLSCSGPQRIYTFIYETDGRTIHKTCKNRCCEKHI